MGSKLLTRSQPNIAGCVFTRGEIAQAIDNCIVVIQLKLYSATSCCLCEAPIDPGRLCARDARGWTRFYCLDDVDSLEGP